MSALLGRLANFEGKRIAVYGDLVADVFVHGEISRISREAPVLILNQRETQVVPGGGANAVHNLKTLGAHPFPVGIVGDDAEGRTLIDFFAGLHVDTSGIRTVATYRTPSKMRILAGSVHGHRQQVVRIDAGEPLGDEETHKETERVLRRAVKTADALLVSDYGYGFVTPHLVSMMRKLFPKTPATLDSRFSLKEYTGMTAATPNEPEIEAALGTSIGNDVRKLETAGKQLRYNLRHNALLITRGKDGMALFERRREPVHIPVFGSDEVADVTGAGDTVIATFTLALAAGASFEEAARIANYAGGIVVMKHGTRPVFFEELVHAIESEENI
jgi:rfaE bifunctional protein kinase chain/domain